MTTVTLLPKKTDNNSGVQQIEVAQIVRDENTNKVVAVVTPTGTIFPASRIVF